MFKNHISAGIASFLLCSGMMLGLSGVADASSTVNIDRDDVAYHREMDNKSKNYDFQYEPQQGIKVGYIITGDCDALLDDNTMEYIRRVLHTKFPGARYPMERMENIDGHIHVGRRNTGDTFILSEAHDVLALEFEKLENMYQRIPRRVITRNGSKAETSNGLSFGVDFDRWGYGNYYDKDYDRYGINSGITFGSKSTSRQDVVSDEIDSLGSDNTYDFTSHLTTLPKEDYVQFVRELEEEGLGGYDYLIMFNIKPLKSEVKGKLFGSTRQSDFRLSVRAIDVATGRYIDRGEYLSRGTSSSARLSLPVIGDLGPGPSWRRAMRKSLIDAMIKSFDHMPIGKYSVCDNPYCVRRQDEIRMENVFGKNHRHCVKHCNDRTFCGDHMVDYQIDADLPSGYAKGQKDELYIRD
ncbi:hypothetical protein [uncultured Anaerovibrio sp.]|uniref:hypothetical protein n=1 Tax=uncultured Anaerovibrio sp. TaxID=361586 RepID=UPI0026256BE3|nr:hypothetical protein [uncultured Anaerovibrio sp.]